LFFDTEVIVHKEFDPPRQTSTEKFYCDGLRQQRENIWHKRPDKWGNNSWAPHHHNALAHMLLAVQQFLASLASSPNLPTHRSSPPVNFYFLKDETEDQGAKF
jgi:hypothetical protein